MPVTQDVVRKENPQAQEDQGPYCPPNNKAQTSPAHKESFNSKFIDKRQHYSHGHKDSDLKEKPPGVFMIWIIIIYPKRKEHH